MTKSDKPPPWLRLTAFGVGTVAMLWLPVEDVSETGALMIAIAVSTLFAAQYFTVVRELRMKQYLAGGTVAGVLVCPLTIALLIFKNGLHAHSTPDFSAQQLFSILKRTPYWGLGGVLLGLGVGLFHTGLSNS